jgi:uncharacterized membrane protein YGL010W
MKKIDYLINEYHKDHLNPFNQKIHKLCVPLIMWSIIGLIWSIPSPGYLTQLNLNWALLFIFASMSYWLVLSFKYFLLMLPFIIGIIYSVYWVGLNSNILLASIVVFIISWLFQFWGHKIEGKKPSFFQDVTFLLIGPLWVAKSLFNIK